MKRCTAIFITVATAVLFLSSCKQSGSSSSSGALIGIAMPETQVTHWVKDGATLKAEAEKRGYRAEVQFADADQAIQNRQIQTLIGLDAKLLIVGSVSAEVAPAIAETAKKNVSVIAFDRLIQNSADYDYFITFNGDKIGELQGRSLAEALGLENADPKAPKSVALFAGSITDANAFSFYDGAMGVLNPYIEKGVLKVVGPYPKTSADKEAFEKIATGWQSSTAKELMSALLKNEAKNLTLDAVLSPNDNIARAIIEVCRTDAKYKNKLPLITGLDGEFESMMLVKSGDQLCTVFKNTTQLSEAAIILADQILKGQTPDIPGAYLAEGPQAKLGDTGKKTVKTYLIDPILITKENINIPVDAGFYTASESEALK
ncbi:MAG: sugar-binding protein [Chitinispirillales bacterium]|nr:sugar-binding protein [Chitinispirillales bacterium]